MSVSVDTVGLGAAVALSASLGILLHHLVLGSGSPTRRFVAEHAQRLDRELSFQRFPLRGPELVVIQLGVGAGAAVSALALEVHALGLIAISAAFAPGIWLERRRASRVLAMEEQLSAWLVSVSGALRSGNPIGEALNVSLCVTPRPLADEIRLVIDEHHLGVPLDRALNGFSARVGSRTVSSAVFVLALARQTGGDVPHTLERAAGALRELARLEGVVRTKTAESKAQALVISLMPAPLVGVIEVSSPGFFSPLTRSVAGYAVIAGCAVLWTAAILLARRIVQVEV